MMPDPSDHLNVEEDVKFRTIWDTADVPPSDRFSYYREGICQTYFAISPEMQADRQFNARIEVASLQGGNVSTLTATPHRNCRTEGDLAKIDGNFLTLNLQRVNISMNLDRKEYAVVRGNIVLMDLQKKCTFEMSPEEKRLHVTLIIFPRSKIEDLFGSRDVLLYDKYSLQALSYCLGLLEERGKRGSKRELEAIFDASISLITAELLRDRDFLEDECNKQESTAAGIFEAIKAFMEANASDPCLSVSFVTSRFGISDRYLHKLFEQDKISFKSFLTTFRLNKIRDELIKTDKNNKTASEIALKWGFRDMSTFYRNFKSTFDESPYRMQRLINRNDGNRT